MTAAVPILAAGGEDPAVKVVIGLIVGGFWVVSQVYAALTKKPDQKLPPSRTPSRQRPADAAGPPQLSGSPRSPGSPLPPGGWTGRSPPPTRTPRGPQRPAPLPPQRSVPARPQTTARRPATGPVAAPPLPPVRRPSATPAPRTPSQPDAKAARPLADVLVKRSELKRAFVLNELLQPPVSLRNPAGD